MTTEELYEKYTSLFITQIELTGVKLGNETYMNIGKTLKKSDKAAQIIQSAVDAEIPLCGFIAGLISILILELNGEDSLENQSEDTTAKLIDDVYISYLKLPTRRFTSKYGLPPIGDSLETSLRVTHKEDEGEF